MTQPTHAHTDLHASQQRWRDERRYLNEHRHELAQLAPSALQRHPAGTRPAHQRRMDPLNPHPSRRGPTGLGRRSPEPPDHRRRARVGQRLPSKDRLPFRQSIGDPRDLACRTVVPAASVLTIRRSRTDGPTMLLHRRDSTKVAHGGGLYQVVPVGVFQPTSPTPTNRTNDYDLSRFITREYDEELLGAPENTSDEPLDYDAWPFYQAERFPTGVLARPRHGPTQPRHRLPDGTGLLVRSASSLRRRLYPLTPCCAPLSSTPWKTM